MLRKSREEILKDFKAQVAQGKILVGVGAGTGITAKCSEKADVDMLIIYNSGRFRMAGRGSLSGILFLRASFHLTLIILYHLFFFRQFRPVLLTDITRGIRKHDEQSLIVYSVKNIFQTPPGRGCYLPDISKEAMGMFIDSP